MTARYVLGIDLGTTNSVLSYAALDADAAEVKLLEIPQLVTASTTELRSALPSFTYLATEQEASDGGLDLPWSESRRFAVGEYARNRSAEAPDRTVGAAKSWLCHQRVDRRQPILPWNAPNDVGRISPVEASQHYLEHLVAAWQQAFPDAAVADQQVVLTVPASFDPVARELTREAAIAAGLPRDFLLLEEPQAALYAWLATTGERWRKMLKVGETVLVCDIGGGTTDLTLVRVTEESGTLALERVAVGNHLLVGGDNMDLTLAHVVATEFEKKGVKLNPWQSVSLWHSCRAAKESLLSVDGPEKQSISVLGRGSKLIGGTVSVEVDRASVSNLLVDGFLPRCSAADRPQKQRASGFQEIGLPFESDPGITRHLAAFLAAHGTDGGSIFPTHVLFNGGVLKAEALRSRLLDVMRQWCEGERETDPLEGVHDLDHAVSRGAAYYGWAKGKGGVRIRGGVARSYYIGIETAGLAIPGAPRPLRALCVVPFGMEEGTQCDVPSGQVGLVLGEPVQFRFFSSATRKDDHPGDILSSWDESELTETVPLEATLPADADVEDTYVPVTFESRVTELGMLELWCVGANTPGRWKLEFSVREETES
ncbi:MAG: Hsp70 family protein [Planctomycetaceae bacterium]|nr:Hsp70 family protein [Planctomycetales bacterium]MCB9921892.1 Hsp70 family protein [Planctomycetaceae bacterium]